MKTVALLLVVPATLFAQELEEPSAHGAAAILKPEFAIGVRDLVPTDRGRNGNLIDTEFGILKRPATPC